MFGVVWFVVAWFAVVCDLLCGVVWFVLFVCVPDLCACVLFVFCVCPFLCLRVLNVLVCLECGLMCDVV